MVLSPKQLACYSVLLDERLELCFTPNQPPNFIGQEQRGKSSQSKEGAIQEG